MIGRKCSRCVKSAVSISVVFVSLLLVLIEMSLSFLLYLDLFCSDLWDGEYKYVPLHQSHVSAFPGHTAVCRGPFHF